MATSNPLDEAPVEVLEAIVRQLELRDARKLRLSNRSIAAKMSEGHFKTYFSSKRIQIQTDHDLRRLVQVTQHGWMGNSLQHLVIVGRAYANPKSAKARQLPREEAVDLLGEAFSNLRRNSASASLASLSLTMETRGPGGRLIEVQKLGDWRQIWKTAASTFYTTIQAMQTSALPARKLDIFGDVLRCSLAIDQFAEISKMKLGALQEYVEELSLNLSNHVLADGDDENAYPLHLSEQHTSQLCSFLHDFQSIRSLKLRWYMTEDAMISAALTEEQNFFRRLIGSIDLSSLRGCSLTGAQLQTSDLLNLLEKAQLESLTLVEINLPPGSWGQVFERVIAQEHLKYLKLENLHENIPISFDIPGEPPFPFSEPNGPLSLTRENEDARSAISFYRAKGRPFDSAAFSRRQTRRDFVRGPPWN